MALYNRRVLNDPEVHLAFSDPLAGIVTPEEFTLELDNTDRYFDTLDLRGERLDLNRFDVFSAENQWELTGLVTSQHTFVDRVVLRVVAQDLADLQTLLPRRTVTAALFPNAHPTNGLGKPIPIVCGNAASTNKVTDAWEMAYVGEDVAGNKYDFLVGEGTFTNITAYRTTVGEVLFEIPASEYTVDTTSYPGFTTLRFSLLPVDFGGGYDRRFVAANSATLGRNGISVLQALLNNSTYGLGLSVNAASFSAAVTDWNGVNPLYVDGALDVQRPALDWINDILIMRGLRLERNASGEWTVAIMKYTATIKALLGHGATQTNGGIVEGGFGGLQKVSTAEAIKTLILDYRYDRFGQRFTLATAPRTPFSFGQERRIQNSLIRDSTTGDKTCCFIGKRLQYAGDALSCTADLRARQMRPGELFRYESDAPVLNRVFLVHGLKRTICAGTTALQGVGYDSDIFVYDPRTVPNEPPNTTPTDYTRLTPAPVTGLVLTQSGVERNKEGFDVAYLVVQYAVPNESWAQTYVRVRQKKVPDDPWLTVDVDQQIGVSAKDTKIIPLITNVAYDIRISRVNTFNPSLAADADLLNQLTPYDTQAPGTPGTPTITGKHLKDITFQWTASSGGDVKDYEWEVRTASGGGGSVLKTARAGTTKTSTTLDAATYGTTYYFRVRGHDYSGNDGTWSADVSFSFTRAVTDDVTDGNITTPKVADNAITVIAQYSNTGPSIFTATTETEIGTITLSTNGGTVILLGVVNIELLAGNDEVNTIVFRIRQTSTTGTMIGIGTMEGHIGPSAGRITHLATTVTIIGIDTSPSGSQVYKLTAHRTAGTAANVDCYLISRFMVPLNAKK